MAYARRDIRGGAVQTTITAGISSGATSCAIAASTGWPDGATNGPFYVVIDPGLATEEKILCSTRSTLTVNFTTRGADGSTASAHASGATIYPIVSAVDIDEANYAVSKTVGKVTTSGDILVADGANSFTRLAKGSNSRALTVDSGGTIGWTTVTAAMAAADMATQAELDAHISDTSDAHDASAVSFAPAGTIAATDTQAAVEEVATDAATALSTHESDTTAVHGITDTSALVTTARTITSGNGLTGGGDLSSDRTLAVGAGTGIAVGADDVGIDPVVVNLGASSTTWTTTFGGTSGALGNATVSKRWTRIGRLIFWSLSIKKGSTTNFSTSQLTIALPVAAADPGSFFTECGFGRFVDVGAGNTYALQAHIDHDVSNSVMKVSVDVEALDGNYLDVFNQTNPVASTDNDLVILSGFYEAAS